MFCPRCGTESPADVRYCYSCGAELPPSASDGQTPADRLRGGVVERLQRLVGRTRRERVVSGLIVGLLVVAVIGFIALDPAEDEPAASAAQDALDADCAAARARVVEASDVLAEPDGAEAYALRVVVAMMDLRDAAAASGLSGTEDLRAAALDVAAAAGRVGRLSREGAPAAEQALAEQQSTETTARLSSAAEDLGLDDCSRTAPAGQ